MGDPVSVGSIGAFGALLKTLQSIKDLAVGVEVKAKVTDLYDIILSGQAAAFEENLKQRTLLEEVRELKEQIASLEAWNAEKQRYALAEPWSGAVVYALKESAASGEPPHYICTHCYEDRRKSILGDLTQFPAKGAQGHAVLLLNCSKCKAQLQSEWHGGSVERKYAEHLKA